MEFWNSILTEKSWNKLQDLRKEKFKFILIGGWAAYLYTGQHKSKDIDIIIPDFNNLEVLKREYNLIKNDNLRKYEIKMDEIEIDIYLPYYSRLSIPLEDVLNKTENVMGFSVVSPEVLLVLKQGAEIDRRDSVKGQKDRIDIMTLLSYSKVDFNKYMLLLKKYKIKHFSKRLKEIIRNFKDIKHLNLNERKYAIIKKRILKELL